MRKGGEKSIEGRTDRPAGLYFWLVTERGFIPQKCLSTEAQGIVFLKEKPTKTTITSVLDEVRVTLKHLFRQNVEVISDTTRQLISFIFSVVLVYVCININSFGL